MTARLALTRALLLAGLLLGLVTMHTLGHPAPAHAAGPPTAHAGADASTAAGAGIDASAAAGAGHAGHGQYGRPPQPTGAQLRTLPGTLPAGVPHAAGGPGSPNAAEAAAVRAAGAGSTTSGRDRAGTAAAHAGEPAPARADGAAAGLDPMAVCLAVLGALVVLALGGGHPLARRARPTPYPGRTRLRWAAGRAPPSRTVVLRV